MRNPNEPGSSEETIRRLIAETPQEGYDAAISGMDDPQVFYHLSSLRSGLLCWYPFDPGWRTLEIGGGYGALTGTLLRKTARVDTLEVNRERAAALERRYADAENLRVFCRDILQFETEERYDCIVLCEVLEELGDALPQLCEKVRALLRPEGVVLTCFRNRFGLRYFCGGVDERVTTPFSGIDGTAGGPGFRLLSRADVLEAFGAAGFNAVQTHYPLPNAVDPQVILSADFPARDGVRDRIIGFDPFRSPVVLEEEKLYDELIRNGMMDGLANDYLIEFRPCGTQTIGRRVTFAALSTDRGEEHGFATVLYDDDTAEKISLSPRGMATLRRLCRNAEALAQRGLPVVRHTLLADRIRMPQVKAETLLSTVHRLADAGDLDGLYALFDALLSDILRSAPLDEALSEEEAAQWGAAPDALGPILQEGYPDMIPYNAFWAEGKILYCDQEFSVPRCPALYVLFRAIRYTWLHLPQLEELESRARFAAHYGLQALWEGFLRREDAFVAENRRYELFAQVYAWHVIDHRAMAARRQALLDSRPRKRDPLPAVHAVQLAMLKRFDAVCAELGLRYCAIHGTLLGCVRHAGFIPWDDDVDLAMPRPDYDRLLREAPPLLAPRYTLQTPESDEGCFYGGYAKLRDNETTATDALSPYYSGNQGIYLDILPLDFCPETAAQRSALQGRIAHLQRLLYALHLPKEAGFFSGHLSPQETDSLYAEAAGKDRAALCRQLKEAAAGSPPTGKLGILACYYQNRANPNIFDASLFSDFPRMPFGDMQLPVPAGSHAILEARYGEDYRDWPPPERRRSSHQVRFDPARSWRNPALEEMVLGPGAQTQKRPGGREYGTGLVMGVFDLFHIGHLNLIRRAAACCDTLRVGVLSDELVYKFKKITPTIPLAQRVEILRALRDVDEVVVIDDDPSRLVEWHRRPFDCFFSGDDYAGNPYWAWERGELQKLGADIRFFPYTKTQSSTRIRGQMKSDDEKRRNAP